MEHAAVAYSAEITLSMNETVPVEKKNLLMGVVAFLDLRRTSISVRCFFLCCGQILYLPWSNSLLADGKSSENLLWRGLLDQC
jgi:hypothetical protein